MFGENILKKPDPIPTIKIDKPPYKFETLSTAKESELDTMAKVFGMTRDSYDETEESDNNFREKILNAVRPAGISLEDAAKDMMNRVEKEMYNHKELKNSEESKNVEKIKEMIQAGLITTNEAMKMLSKEWK